MTPRELWDRLSPAEQNDLMVKFRFVEVDDNQWFAPIHESFRSRMAEIGIDCKQIFFSGFWSQGDGACFEGCIDRWDLFLHALGDEELTKVAAGLPTGHLSDNLDFVWKHHGCYYHEHCMRFEMDWSDPDKPECPLQAATFHAIGMDFHHFSAKEDALIEFVRSKAKQLYRELEKEYEHLTSDESVLDYILANEADRLEELALCEEEHF